MADGWSDVLSDSYRTREGADIALLDAAESALGVVLPMRVRELYAHSDGLYDPHGYPWIWAVEDLVDENTRLRESPNFDVSVIAIGGDGAGDIFCVRSGAANSRTYCWYPIEDGLRELAGDLDTFLRGWANGAIAT